MLFCMPPSSARYWAFGKGRKYAAVNRLGAQYYCAIEFIIPHVDNNKSNDFVYNNKYNVYY